MTEIHLTSAMSSISRLQGTCNTSERRLGEKLISLTIAKDENGVKVTEAIFEPVEDGFPLGNLRIKSFSNNDDLNSGFKGTAFIMTVSNDVYITR